MHLKLIFTAALFMSLNAQAELDQVTLEKANKGDATAQVAIGDAYAKGMAVPRDHTEALKWYKKAAQLGDIQAHFELGVMLMMDGKNDEDKSQGIALIHHAAEQNLAEAQVMLGSIHGMRKEFDASAKWLIKAADQGDASALSSLGLYYEGGLGVPKSLPKAIEVLTKSADLGNPTAQVYLGDMYAQARGVKKNYKKAAELYKLAADQNNGEGQARLGVVYRDGVGIAKDLNEAVKYYRLSAAQNNTSGILGLSGIYFSGKGGKKSAALGYALVSRCAEDCKASKRIELMHLTEMVTIQDVEIGKKLHEEMIKRDDILSVVDEYEKTL